MDYLTELLDWTIEREAAMKLDCTSHTHTQLMSYKYYGLGLTIVIHNTSEELIFAHNCAKPTK